jgi:hypothetical protein
VGVNVVFSIWNGTGFGGYLVVTEDHQTNLILSANVQVTAFTYRGENWSGYEMGGSIDFTNPVWQSTADWTVPTADENPQGWCDATKSPYGCDFGVWTGLTHFSHGGSGGAGTGIAQTGSRSFVPCQTVSGQWQCTRTYQLWYQFWPADTYAIPCQTINNGDSIHAYVTNQAINPGGNSSKYNLMISDNTLSVSCSVSNRSFAIGNTYFGEFIGEIGGAYRLAKFSPVTTTGYVYYSGSSHGIYTPYNNGWYNPYVMSLCILFGGCFTNTAIGSVNTNNAFTQTWQSSQGP